MAWYINKMPSPFLTRSTPPAKAGAAACGEERSQGRGQVRGGRSRREAPLRFLQDTARASSRRPSSRRKHAQKASAAGERETFFLQAGAFQNAPDADNLKARLALVGVEATIQTASLPDKGVLAPRARRPLCRA